MAALRRALALRRAPAVRAALGAGTTAYRLVHDAADGLPGLVIDRYGPVARLELYDVARWRPEVSALTEVLLAEEPALRGVCALTRPRRGRGELWTVAGEVPSAHVVQEDGWRFFVRVADAGAVGTGLFVDQREGRRLVLARGEGRPMLNLFAHAGGFGVAAAAGGASRVDHVDAARKCAPWAAVNLALNGADPRQHRFLVDDALKVLRRAGRRGPTYGVIVCDPPTTALTPKGERFKAREALGALAADASLALLPEGTLLLSTNDRSVSPAEVAEAAHAGAEAAGRRVRGLEEVAMPPDLPPGSDPDLRPMRGVALQVA
jgi:23S rRNA (cytosine1962-C5)-methyltransferase